MPAGILDLTIEQGATFASTLTWTAAAEPVDLTGYTARMMIRRTYEDADALITLTTENDGITLGGEEGTIDLLITAAQTAALTRGSGVYDLELVSGSTVTRLLQGSVRIAREVTR